MSPVVLWIVFFSFLFGFCERGGCEVETPLTRESPSSTALCPLRCLCFRTTVRCMFLHLEKIPNIPKDTTILDLRFNRIRNIPPDSFIHLTNLNTLLLNNNHITRLENGAFNGLSDLKYLYLYKNRIREIEPKVFRGLPQLEQLYIHYNFLQEIQAETFSNLTKLERLFLHNNKIQRIPYGSFNNLLQMKRLRLDSNALVCDCGMLGLAQMLTDHPDTQAAATCQQPASMQGKPITALQEMNLHCRKPTITEEPRDVEVNFGNTVYFSCKAEGDPTPNIVWLHNSNEISTNGEPRYSILHDGTLMIANAQDEDAGAYECMAKSPVGEAKSRSAKMNYKRQTPPSKMRPRFLQAPVDTDVSESESFNLLCEASGNPKPQLFWSFNDAPLQFSSRHQISASGTLSVKNAIKKDEGVYRCTAVNSVAKISAVAEVRVQSAPLWVVTPLDQTLRFGETLELKCEASGRPNPTLTWSKDNSPLSPSPRISITHKGRLLKISSVRADEDGGEYGCKAENTAGSLQIFANIKISPGSPPLFTNDHSFESFNVIPGRELQLPCAASGIPPPTILWKRNGITLIENSRMSILPRGTLLLNPYLPDRDGGLYECSAYNDHGFITDEGIKVEGRTGRRLRKKNEDVDDSLILHAVTQARKDVQVAENDTLELLFGKDAKKEFKSPIDLLRLARFPRKEGRNIARAAEIYERALKIIGKHVEDGMNFTASGDFSYNELLSQNQLETLGRFSGCLPHKKRRSNCSEEMCFHTKYRSIDGSCNNLGETTWGNAYTAFQRLLPSAYENGFNLPIGWDPNKFYNGFTKPSARLISNRIINTESVSPDTAYTHMLMQWGQFVDHDLDHTLPSLSIESFGERVNCKSTCKNVAPCFPIPAPEGDFRIRTRKCIEFTRSAAVCGSGMTSILFDTIQQREQINQLTSFIDASQVYGSSSEELLELRSKSDKALLRHGIYQFDKPLMPFATDNNPIDCRRNTRESGVGCFLGGDVRANEQLGLLAMHTIWFRQHNFIALKIRAVNPRWDEETVFQETRKIVGAQMQIITYNQWLPNVIGAKGMEILGKYEGYKPHVNPTITTEFATAALRFGHTLINPLLRRLDPDFKSIREGDLPLRNSFFAPWRLLEEGGIDPLLRGLFASPAKLRTPSELLNSHLTNDLFTAAHAVALDLAAMNIQRGRDHGIPSYNEYRVFCNLTRATSFDDLKDEIHDAELRGKLQDVYKHVDNIDLWVGGVAEDPQWDDQRLGPTFACILIDQFRRLRDGDRFWYENPSVFKPEQLVALKETSLAKVLCDNGDSLEHVKLDVFGMDSPLVRCDLVPEVHFGLWATECCGTSTTCPSSSTQDLENNQIRVKRSLEDPPTLDIQKIEEKLTLVASAVTALKNRIKALEQSCDHSSHDNESHFAFNSSVSFTPNDLI